MISHKNFHTGICAKLLLFFSLIAFSVSAKAACEYKINQASQWYFSATTIITNSGSVPVSVWDVTFEFVDGTTPTGGYTNGNYNLSFSGSGPFTVTGQGSNGNTLAPGSSVSLTIQGNGGSAVLASLTGSLCSPAEPQNQSLTIVKEVVNDHGGNSDANDFGITTSAGTITFGTPTGTGTAADPLVYTSAPISVAIGTYTLSENDLAGYTEGAWSCTGASGGFRSNFDNGKLEIGKDENVICTISNDDIDGAIAGECEHTVRVGRTRFNGQIKITNTGLIPINGWDIDWSYSDGSVITSSYNVVLTGSNPYHGSNVSYNGTIAVGSSVTFGFSGIGGGALATLTGSFCGPFSAAPVQSLTIEKRVINDNGGTSVVGDFNLATDAGALTFSAGTTTGNTTTYQSVALPVTPGTYSLSESDLAAYSEGTWKCSGANGTVSNTFDAGLVEIDVGEEVTCAIANDDILVEPVTENVDLVISKVVSNATPNIGDVITFTLTVVNNGPDQAANVLVEDLVNAGFTLVASSMTGGDAQNQSAPGLEWTINSLPAGAANAETLSYQVTVLSP